MKLLLLLCSLVLVACDNDIKIRDNFKDIPLCSSGKKVELDVNWFKTNRPLEYEKLPQAVKVFKFRPFICKPD